MKKWIIIILMLIALVQAIKIVSEYNRIQELQSLINYEVDR